MMIPRRCIPACGTGGSGSITFQRWASLHLPSPKSSETASQVQTQRKRRYHSYDHDASPEPYSKTEDDILSASILHVPDHGFTERALALGAKDAGYLDVSVNLFPRKAFELVNYHLVSQRRALKDRIDFTELERDAGKALGVGTKVRMLAWKRLMANANIIHRWQEALAVMAQPSNIPPSIAELARLSDEIWFLAGDVSVDTSWYTKRASLSTIYSATELYMTQDTSPNFTSTAEFLDRRLADAQVVGQSIANVNQWVGFTASAVVNVLRSKGVRI